MAAMSDYLETQLINAVLRGGSYSGATVYVALYTTATDDASGGSEVTGGGYAREAVTFSAPSNGVASNSATVTFPAATASWGTVTHVAITDASSGGNRLFHGPLAISKSISSGDVFTLPAGQLEVTVQ